MFNTAAKILIVDDMLTIRKITKKALVDLRYKNIEEAANGTEAWQIISKSPAFDFIICDWNMPKMTGLEVLSKLRPAFRKDGTVTAGNASGLNDGAAALLFASEEALKKYSLKPLARIVSMGAAGVAPRIMGIGPVEAANKALAKAGLTMNDMDVIELNEAFAAQSLACIRSWGLKDDDARINPNGGAIALGHPLGMSGARILLSAAIELHEQNKKYALVTMCIGVGQGYAVIIERS